MSTPAQSYANHRAIPPLAWAVAILVLMVNAVWQVILACRALGFGSILGVLVALALLVVAYYARRSAQVVQDRVIRLETRLRLERLLPPERHGEPARLTLPQLVGLRFAGDGELPALVEEALGQALTNTAIKRKITSWQADWLRV